MKQLLIEETTSTNTLLKEHPDLIGPMTMAIALRQTSGRGQRGNFWESEAGKNLTFSFHFKPEGTAPAEQFAISEAVALAIAETLSAYGIEARVKWPNDIYAGDRKICGILIEHSLFGKEITRSIVGIGLNVNQREFRSDAPNPVSMWHLTGRKHDIESLAMTLGERLEKNLGIITTKEGKETTHRNYLGSLYRGDGLPYRYREASSGEEFMGIIRDVEPSGHILIEKESGTTGRYAFKEIVFI